MYRRALAVAAAVAAVLVTATGCPGSTWHTTDADRSRLATMTADPVLAGVARADRSAHPGVDIHDGYTYRRGRVDATLRFHRTGRSVDATATQVATTTARLRSAGWTVYYARCAPPARQTDPTATASVPPNPDFDTWTWVVSAYRFVRGVSYAARLDAHAERNGESSARLTLLAPDASEPTDLFPDRPAGLDRTCADAGTAPRALQRQGPAITVRDSVTRPHHPVRAGQLER